MPITVKCFANLTQFQPKNSKAFEIQENETVGSVLDRLGVPADQVALVFVNNVITGRDTVLKDGDSMGIFPPIGGG